MAQELPTARIQLDGVLCALNLPPFELEWQPSGTAKASSRPASPAKTVAQARRMGATTWLHYLSNDLGYPLNLTLLGATGLEWPIPVCRRGVPRPGQPGPLMVELKRPDVALSKTVLDQVLRYRWKCGRRSRDFKWPATKATDSTAPNSTPSTPFRASQK